MTARKLCECGCGDPTLISHNTDQAKGWIKGEPRRFLQGHQNRIGPDYLPEDRGHDTPCWIWQRCLNAAGYGDTYKGLAHRVYYERFKGSIPNGAEVHHECDVPACVNPDHLAALTHAAHCRLSKTTKLSTEAVAEIRESGERTVALAERFGVTTRTINRVRSGEIWAVAA